MIDQPGTPRDCDAYCDDLVEFGLGLLSGRRRAEVLEHLETCSRCAVEMEGNVIAADALLALTPEIDPPIGFETRLVKRFDDRRVSRHRPFRVALSAAAAVLAIVLGFGIGALATDHGNSHSAQLSANTVSAQLALNGHGLGSVYLASGSPAWMFMSVDYAHWSGEVWCQITTANGNQETVGRFNLVNGYGAWGVPLHVKASDILSASLVDVSGVVLGKAELRS
ncbi:MAG TPA: zf-HC2 domain-containing protein [Acidimicrobiales bacterium]|nr:zf-HC2 domain-containing protein [Acidimicrobiales bacterium]